MLEPDGRNRPDRSRRRRRLVVVGAVVAIALQLGGCSPRASESSTSAGQVLPTYREVQPEDIAPEALPPGWVVRPVGAEGVALMGPQVLRVSFGGLAEPKFKLTLAEIQEGPDVVSIDLLGASPGGDVGVGGPAASYQHTFTLDAHLGNRKVILNGRAVPVAVAE